MISHAGKFILRLPAKNGTTSLVRALRPLPIELTGAAPPGSLFYHPDNRHAPWSWYAENYPQEFESYELLDILRNPWERSVSWHGYTLRTNFQHLILAIERSGGEIRDGIWTEYFQEQCLAHKGLLPPVVTKSSPRNVRYLHASRLEEDWRAYVRERELSLPTTLPRQNVSPTPTSYPDHYTPESAAALAIYYQADIEAGEFKYPWLPGDAIARITSLLGLQKCTACERRRRALNSKFLKTIFSPLSTEPSTP